MTDLKAIIEFETILENYSSPKLAGDYLEERIL